MVKTIFEFYYYIGASGPSSAYRLEVEKETEKTYKCIWIALRPDGSDSTDTGRYRVHKSESTLITFPAGAKYDKILVRIPCEDFKEAKARANKMVKAQYEEWANEIIDEE